MATSRKSSKTTTTSGTRKATPAGRKSRTSPTRKSSSAETAETATHVAPVVSVASEARTHLRAVEPVTTAVEAGGETRSAGADTSDDRFKRPDLIEAVSERTSLKRSDAKVVLELVLDELGKALDANEELVLPPLGKLMVKRRKPDGHGPDILTVKIRRPRQSGDGPADTPLADAGEDG